MNDQKVPEFQHATPPFRTFSGHDALSALPRELDRLGSERVVVFCGTTIAAQQSALQRVEAAVGKRLVGRFEGVREHSPLPSVTEASRLLAELDADGIVAVGGGSSIVTARAAAILLAERKSPHDLCTRRIDGQLSSPKLSKPKIPLWLVPSTPTTAYAKAGAAVREHDTGARLSFFDPKTRAQGVFFDPVLALTAPVQLAVSASLTAFAAAVDGLQSSSVDPLAQALLTHALRLSSAWIPQMAAEPRSAAARLHVMTAALLAGQGSDFAGSGLGAAISHALGPRSGTANGVVEAILLPHTIRFNAPVTDGRLTDIAALFGTAADAERVADAVQQLLADIGCPQQLRDIGVSPEILDDVAEQAADDWFASQVPRPASRVQLLELLITAW